MRLTTPMHGKYSCGHFKDSKIEKCKQLFEMVGFWFRDGTGWFSPGLPPSPAKPFQMYEFCNEFDHGFDDNVIMLLIMVGRSK